MHEDAIFSSVLNLNSDSLFAASQPGLHVLQDLA